MYKEHLKHQKVDCLQRVHFQLHTMKEVKILIQNFQNEETEAIHEKDNQSK